jgi:metal-sulfur cluster biosynthetic enzyme
MERVTDFIDETSPKRETVIRALDECMGLIERVELQGGNVSIEMVLTSGWCPFAARLLEMIQEEVGQLPEVDAVDVDVVWDPTWIPERMSAEAREKLRLPLEKLAPLREARLRGESA